MRLQNLVIISELQACGARGAQTAAQTNPHCAPLEECSRCADAAAVLVIGDRGLGCFKMTEICISVKILFH